MSTGLLATLCLLGNAANAASSCPGSVDSISGDSSRCSTAAYNAQAASVLLHILDIRVLCRKTSRKASGPNGWGEPGQNDGGSLRHALMSLMAEPMSQWHGSAARAAFTNCDGEHTAPSEVEKRRACCRCQVPVNQQHDFPKAGRAWFLWHYWRSCLAQSGKGNTWNAFTGLHTLKLWTEHYTVHQHA